MSAVTFHQGAKTMGAAGIGSALSVGSQYDFTKMTNQQLFDAVQTLGSEGKISQTDESQLSFIAQGVDSVPMNGPSLSASQIVSDSTQHNFIAELQNDDYGANLSGSVGGTFYNSMLQALESYQSGSTATAGSTLSFEA